MSTIAKVLTLVGAIESVLFLAGLSWGVMLWLRGIAPALIRLGDGLARRKIALFAKGDNAASLTHLLTDSRLFRTSNIIQISKAEDLGRAERASVFLVFWHDWADHIHEILGKKPDACPLVVYSPYDLGKIPTEQMKELDGLRHTAVTNFRGRLLNDIVASMITTSYDKH